jgi:hypothetical protein
MLGPPDLNHKSDQMFLNRNEYSENKLDTAERSCGSYDVLLEVLSGALSVVFAALNDALGRDVIIRDARPKCLCFRIMHNTYKFVLPTTSCANLYRNR